MMQSVQIGLVGCGSFGESHLQAFRAIPHAKVTAVFDLDHTRAEALAKDFDIPRVCKNLEELCSLSELQAIDVVTNESAHAEVVVAACEAGKHAFVEKPFATVLQDCDRMIEVSERTGRFLMVGHVLRFETRYAMLKESIDAKAFGRVISIHARRNRPRSLLISHGRTHPVLLSSIHDIDFVLWCVASRVLRVRGYARHGTRSEQVDTFWSIIEFVDGTIACIETHSLIPGQAGIDQDDACQIMGDAGVGKLQFAPGTLSYWTNDGFRIPDVGYDPRVMNSARGALRDELAYFTNCVMQNQAPTINRGIEGRRAVQVAMALIQSSEQEQDVLLGDWK
jgi:UDP-N-acetylglucosamine 3-dehydrogenase